MTCKCGSNRIVQVCGKVSDMCSVSYGETEREGYVPSGLNIGSGDYLEFKLCMECGTVQGQFPVTDKAIKGKS